MAQRTELVRMTGNKLTNYLVFCNSHSEFTCRMESAQNIAQESVLQVSDTKIRTYSANCKLFRPCLSLVTHEEHLSLCLTCMVLPHKQILPHKNELSPYLISSVFKLFLTWNVSKLYLKIPFFFWSFLLSCKTLHIITTIYH